MLSPRPRAGIISSGGLTFGGALGKKLFMDNLVDTERFSLKNFENLADILPNLAQSLGEGLFFGLHYFGWPLKSGEGLGQMPHLPMPKATTDHFNP